jgi:hypothetical protein
MVGIGQLKRARTWLIISAVGLLGTGAHWCRDVIRVDSCLDAGHVYDYVREACDHSAVTLPVIPYGARHPWIIRGGAAIGVLGVAVAAGVTRREKVRRAKAM